MLVGPVHRDINYVGKTHWPEKFISGLFLQATWWKTLMLLAKQSEGLIPFFETRPKQAGFLA